MSKRVELKQIQKASGCPDVDTREVEAHMYHMILQKALNRMDTRAINKAAREAWKDIQFKRTTTNQ